MPLPPMLPPAFTVSPLDDAIEPFTESDTAVDRGRTAGVAERAGARPFTVTAFVIAPSVPAPVSASVPLVMLVLPV